MIEQHSHKLGIQYATHNDGRRTVVDVMCMYVRIYTLD